MVVPRNWEAIMCCSERDETGLDWTGLERGSVKLGGGGSVVQRGVGAGRGWAAKDAWASRRRGTGSRLRSGSRSRRI